VHGFVYEGNTRRKLMVTSSLNEITKEQLGNRVIMRGWGALLRPLILLSGFLEASD
jgi:hypothetical protein